MAVQSESEMSEKSNYYSHVRHDVLAHIPPNVKRVLSIGCGEGQTEAQLVARGVKVTAVELNPVAAKVAAAAGIEVICGDASSSTLSSSGVLFDCLIYSDVLEHIVDPESVLREHVPLLAPEGIVIVSVPNFRNYSVFWQLFLAGHIHYRDSGIFDRTHVRLTTRRLIQEWFSNVGLQTKEIDYRVGRTRDRLFSMASLGLMREFLAQQVILVGARKK
jgi:2-polyprenyl-3-methyl-5-hydroxy-6-metoxy-1,4-benzoquinol methylase